MKKVLSAFLCVSVAVSAAAGLSGCGKQEKEDNTLVWCIFGDAPKDLDLVLEKANEIIEPKIGMKLDMQYTDSASYAEKMKLKMASGEPYDLAFTGYTNDYHTAVALGGLYDITDLIKETGLDEVIPQFYFDSAEVNGRIYGIPNVQVASNPVCIAMDKTLADEIDADLEGIQELAQNVKNIDDIKAYTDKLDVLFEKVHEARPNMYTINPTRDIVSFLRYEGVIDPIAVLKDGTSDKMEILTDTADWQLGKEKVREWYTKGYIRNDIASKGNTLVNDEERRQIAVRFDTWKPGQDPAVKSIYGDDPVYALLTKPYTSRTHALSTMTSVGANTKHPKEAVEFLKLINTDKELYNLICWGIEGQHYTKDEQGFVTEIEDSGYTGIGKGAWKYGNQFNSLLVVGQEPDVWEQTKKMNDEAIKSPMLGFVPNTESISNEIANITNTNSEFKAKSEFGTVDVSEWINDYTARLEQAGIQKVRDELQKQYDEFIASK